MDINIYQQCPCHSEKKIKFCCGKDIVGDLNKILAKNSAGQGLAALDQLDRAIEKTGPRDCLLTIKTHILLNNEKIDEAKQTNQQFRETNPNHPTGLQHKALIELADGEVALAVESLQSAMEAITGDSIPVALANTFRMVGMGLISAGHLVGSRAHLQFASDLKRDDEETERMILDTFRMRDIPLALKSDFKLTPLANEKEWTKKYTNAIRAIDRGQFRKALKFLKKIDSTHPDQPEVVRGIAVLQMFLGYIDDIGPSWRRVSRLDGISKLDAVEAESLAQIFDNEPASEPVDVVRVSFELNETEKPLEIALSSDRLESLPPINEDPFEEGPAPKNWFFLLDRPRTAAPDQLNLENVSSVDGEVYLFGRQTDRAPRLEWLTAKWKSYDDELQFLQNTFADSIVGGPKTEVISTTDSLDLVSNWKWRVPEGTTRQQHDDLMKLKWAAVLNEGWANLPFHVLDGKTPRAAAQDPQYQIPLQALLALLEQSPQWMVNADVDFDAFRADLGIAKLGLVEFSELSDGNSPFKHLYLNYSELEDDALSHIYAIAMATGNIKAMKLTTPELLNRPHLDFQRDLLWSMMAQMTNDFDEALDCLAKARSEAKQVRRPFGIYLVQELDLRLSHAVTDNLSGLLDSLKRNHMEEPGVQEQVYQVLHRHGLLQDENPLAAMPEAMESAPAAEPASGGIWTGDAGETPVSNDDSEPSKLWIPE